VHRVDLPHLNQQPRLFLEFPLCGLPHVLVVLHVPTGNTPGPLIDAACAWSQNNVFLLQTDNAHTNNRILPEKNLAHWRHQGFTPVQSLTGKGSATAWTILVRPRYGWPAAVRSPLAHPCCLLHCTPDASSRWLFVPRAVSISLVASTKTVFAGCPRY